LKGIFDQLDVNIKIAASTTLQRFKKGLKGLFKFHIIKMVRE